MMMERETEDALEAQRREREAAARAEFQRKLVVADPVFHVPTRKPRDRPQQLDAIGSMLEGAPRKHAFAATFAPPPPISLREGSALAHRAPERIDPAVHKHPEVRAFIYARDVAERLPKKPAPVAAAERQGPLWQRGAPQQ
jgi:hypothetical protein